jgi:hypothetical protein
MADVLKETLKIAFIPGTGNMGKSLARNHAKAGWHVLIGSRSKDKAQLAVDELIDEHPELKLEAGTNSEVAAKADVVFWAPQGSFEDRYSLLKSLQKELTNKIIVDVTNILYMADEKQWGQTSSVLENQRELGAPAKWGFAYKSTFAKLLKSPKDTSGAPVHILIGGDDEAVLTIKALTESCGYKTINMGGLKESKIAELFGPRYVATIDNLNNGAQFNGYWMYTSSANQQ